MNSNFWFNYEKKQEEMKSKPLVEKLEDNMEEDIITSKNDNKKDDKSNKKRSAFIKLMVGIIFIIVIMIVLSLGSNGNIIKEETDNDTNNNVNNEKDSTDIKDIVLNGDYKFEYLIDVVMQDGNKLTYTYIGSSIDGKLSGTIKNMDQEIEYLYKDNEYYIIDNDQYYLVAEEDIFKVIDYKYLNIYNINNYIKKGTQIYKTEYSNGTVTTGYDILIKDIIINSDSDKAVTIVVSENDKYTIEIDYTNLISILNSNIGNCKVTLKYETIK